MPLSENEPQKTCCTCHQPFPPTPSFFHRNRSTSDGLALQCKSCACEALRASSARRTASSRLLQEQNEQLRNPPLPADHLRCHTCHQVLHQSAFYTDRRSKTGFTSNCKGCKAIRYLESKRGIYLKRQRLENLDTAVAPPHVLTQEEYENSPEGKKWLADYNAIQARNAADRLLSQQTPPPPPVPIPIPIPTPDPTPLPTCGDSLSTVEEPATHKPKRYGGILGAILAANDIVPTPTEAPNES